MKRTNNKKKIIIIGAGGHGSELASYMPDINKISERVELCGYVDENKAIGEFNGFRILGDFERLGDFLKKYPKTDFYYITATGNNAIRSTFVKKIESMNASNIQSWSLRHPYACVGQKVEIGEGGCLAPGSVVTTKTKIGKHCILNVHASVAHDCMIGDYVNLNPGAVVCGNVEIGTGAYIGAGAIIIDKITIGDWAVIGAGAVVIRNVPQNVTVVGVPAKIIH